MYLCTHMTDEPNAGSMSGLKAEKYELLILSDILKLNTKLQNSVYTLITATLYCERKCVLRSSWPIPNIILRLFSNSVQIAPQLSSDCPSALLRLLPDCLRRNETVVCHVCTGAQTCV